MADLFQVAITGADKVAKKIAALGPALKEAERRAVFRGSQLMVKTWRRKLSGDVLKTRTAGYKDSITATPPTETNGRFESLVGAGQFYSKIHEGKKDGSPYTIHAKGRVLAIPVGPAAIKARQAGHGALTGAGVARGGPRDYPGGFWTTSKKGNVVFLAPLGGKGSKLELLFVGKESVTIPARRPMGKSFDEVSPLMPRIVAEEKNKAVERVWGV